ncbi:hypothetical protein EVAR_3649_1 [Eumeta japonica]|uniref:Uncharacterized protein n=1 Tax=Eumeta variegata TaxID=151549 RepID=A0A4C1SRC7_EUMVA|nr:hypothetical protein EVAR_3649_1 [Eumeta japonica]
MQCSLFHSILKPQNEHVYIRQSLLKRHHPPHPPLRPHPRDRVHVTPNAGQNSSSFTRRRDPTTAFAEFVRSFGLAEHLLGLCSGGARRRRRRRPPTASRLKGPRKQKSFAYKLLKRGLAKSFAYKLLKRGLANLMSPTSTSGSAISGSGSAATGVVSKFSDQYEAMLLNNARLTHWFN